MSQHYYETFQKGFPITAILGWDRPMALSVRIAGPKCYRHAGAQM